MRLHSLCVLPSVTFWKKIMMMIPVTWIQNEYLHSTKIGYWCRRQLKNQWELPNCRWKSILTFSVFRADWMPNRRNATIFVIINCWTNNCYLANNCWTNNCYLTNKCFFGARNNKKNTAGTKNWKSLRFGWNFALTPPIFSNFLMSMVRRSENGK